MSQGNRRNKLALRGCLIAGLLVAPAALGQPQQQVGASNAEQAAAKESEPGFPAFGQREHGNTKTYRTICKAPYSKEYADLCQQWRVAETAEKQLIATWVSNAALIITLIFTAVATIAASRAAKAAEKAVEVTERTAKHELRAYIDIKEGGFLVPFDMSKLQARIVFQNYGQTPAHNVNSWVRFGLFKPGEFRFERTPIVGNEDEDALISPTNIGTHFRQIAFNQEAYDAVCRGDVIPILWGRIDYTDIFGKRQWFEFRARPGTQSKHKDGEAYALMPTEGGYQSSREDD
jgi:hypothetical protein